MFFNWLLSFYLPYISFGISIEFSNVCVSVSGLLCDAVLVFLSAILLSIKSPDTLANFRIIFFVTVLIRSVAYF